MMGKCFRKERPTATAVRDHRTASNSRSLGSAALRIHVKYPFPLFPFRIRNDFPSVSLVGMTSRNLCIILHNQYARVQYLKSTAAATACLAIGHKTRDSRPRSRLRARRRRRFIEPRESGANEQTDVRKTRTDGETTCRFQGKSPRAHAHHPLTLHSLRVVSKLPSNPLCHLGVDQILSS